MKKKVKSTKIPRDKSYAVYNPSLEGDIAKTLAAGGKHITLEEVFRISREHALKQKRKRAA